MSGFSSPIAASKKFNLKTKMANDSRLKNAGL